MRPSSSCTRTGSRRCRWREGAGLAPLRGGARRARHLLRPAVRAQPRHARRARGGRHARRQPTMRIPGGRGLALHEALLDQHRSVQQPHGAQVRARVRARRLCGARDARGGATARACRSGRAKTSMPCWRACVRCSSTSPATRCSRARTRAGARHPAGEREQPVRRRVAGRSRRVRRAVPAQLAAREAARGARRRGLPRGRPLLAPIERIVSHLEAAVPYATPAMAAALEALVRFYRTGEAADRRAYDIAWVEDRDSPVDTINGFVEVYMDARGRKGAWEALVYYVNPEKTEAIRRIAEHAQWFEDRMPWDPKYRKPEVTGVTARPSTSSSRPATRADDAGRHQPAERPGDPRDLRQQVGVALERLRGLREVDAAGVPRRVLLGRGRGRARHEVGGVRERADDEPARGHRARVGPGLRRPRRHAGGGAARAVLDARGGPGRSRGPLLRRGSSPGRDRSHGRGRPRRRRPGGVRGLRAERPGAVAADPGGVRRSRKITCATASSSCTG
jgi:hypothetical protein